MTTSKAVKNRREELLHFIESELQERGVLHISKDSGMFIGTK
jgi:hypothetical protein